uniref:Uncharacterized protein n=1 Tax=Oryzias sinensis TaxID=183150 RepID=A0A8C7WVB9_9TELE
MSQTSAQVRRNTTVVSAIAGRGQASGLLSSKTCPMAFWDMGLLEPIPAPVGKGGVLPEPLHTLSHTHTWRESHVLVFTEAAHAGESRRRSQAGHEAFLPEEGRQQRRVQGDSAESRPEGVSQQEWGDQPGQGGKPGQSLCGQIQTRTETSKRGGPVHDAYCLLHRHGAAPQGGLPRPGRADPLLGQPPWDGGGTNPQKYAGDAVKQSDIY